MIAPLLVPPPTVTFRPLPGGFATLEDIVSVRFARIRFADGTAVSVEDIVGAHALLTRTATMGGPREVWHQPARRWRSAGELDPNLAIGMPLIPPDEGTAPWQGVLAGAGATDADGEPMIRTATGGFPQYRLRGVFRARRDGIDAAGVGPEGAPLLFASRATRARFATRVTPDAESPTRVQLTLRNASGGPVAMIDIDASGADAVLSLRSFDGGGSPLAAVSLESDGGIRLTPGPGQRVLIDGDLETGRIRYLPASGLPKKTLD